MRRLKKKILFCTCALLLTLNGCAKQENKSEVGQKDTYTLYMQFPVNGTAPEGIKEVQKAISSITEEELGVNVELLPVATSDLESSAISTVSYGKQLDLCLSLGTSVSNLVKTDSILKLDELLEEYGPDIIETCQDQLYVGKYGEDLYGIPISYVRGWNGAFIARKSILDKYQIEIEDRFYTIEELENIFEIIKNGEGEDFYILAGGFEKSNLPFDYIQRVDDFGGGIGILFDDEMQTDGEVENYYASEEYARYAQRMYEWSKKGYFSSDAYVSTTIGSIQMASGKYLGVFAGDTGQTAIEYSAAIGEECVAIEIMPAMVASGGNNKSLWSIAKTCKEPEKTMEFLNLLYKDERIVNLLMYGIEDKSYKVLEKDSHGTLISKIENAPYWCDFGVFGDRLKYYVLYPGTTRTNEELREFSESIQNVSPAVGFIPDFSKCMTEYSSVMNVIFKYRPLINTGAVDPKQELPLFLQELKDAGAEELLKTVREQYGDFLEKKVSADENK